MKQTVEGGGMGGGSKGRHSFKRSKEVEREDVVFVLFRFVLEKQDMGGSGEKEPAESK